MDVNKIMDVAQDNGMIIAPKEQVLDMLYISMANDQIPAWSVKVFEKIFEDSVIVPVPGVEGDPNVSVEDTIAMCLAVTSKIIEASEKILDTEMPVLEDMLMELTTLRSSGAELYQLKNMQVEIDYRITIIAKSNAIIEIVNHYFQHDNTPN